MKLSLTTTLPYVNSDPHVGFALEIVQADIVARYRRMCGDEVFFNTGTDEHGQKIYQKALEAGQDPQTYVDGYASRFGLLKEKLNLSYDAFIRTTDPKHILATQEFWRRCEARGDIYKKQYSVKYCVGCELEKTDSELEDGKCPIHPTNPIELIEEENYFFRFSKYQEPLLQLYAERPDFVVPAHRLNEIRAFVERGLQDFSISRVKEKMPWGIPVPGDDSQVMYVWFDALVNYISTIDWPDEKYIKWWPNIQFAGKDNLRQQSAMWQAMLMSAGVEPSKQIVIHGFITSGGQKMSKSVGNVISPMDIVETYGVDALRYYLARHVTPFEDSDMTMERFHECYTANLVNGLGNLVSRVMKLAETHLEGPVSVVDPVIHNSCLTALDSYQFTQAMDYVWAEVGKLDERMTTEAPFKLVKTDPQEGKRIIAEMVQGVYEIAFLLQPFLPQTAELIMETVRTNKKPETMFPRMEL
jgi:methionyl-tRNA synthetase